VIDDGSTEKCAKEACKEGVTVLPVPYQAGPAAGRNFGACQAKGDILFFVDSDVVIKADVLTKIDEDFRSNPDIAAIFGSYDENPGEKNFISQYKNLFHHFVHQQSNEEAVTFWAGCGAIRREIFLEMDGFDETLYSKPSIEDIELGYRMKRRGHRIWMDKDLQVKHLKKWTLVSLLRTDISHRAIPWSKLMLENREIINDLNLQTSHRISAGLTGLSTGMLPFMFFEPRLLIVILLLLAAIVLLNRKLYSFFMQQRGLIFTLMAFPLHLLYYLYSGITFVICRIRVFLEKTVLFKSSPVK
jgi:GT2 family glycosyltransferase